MKKSSVLNRTYCRKLALEWAKRRTGCDFTRVSEQWLDDLESKVILIIQRSVDSHRSVGKTITDLH